MAEESLFLPYCGILLVAYLPFFHEVFEKDRCPTEDAGTEKVPDTATEAE